MVFQEGPIRKLLRREPEIPEFIKRAEYAIEVNTKSVGQKPVPYADSDMRLGEGLKKAGWHKVADKVNPDGSYTTYWVL